jgi:putative ABC transport system ATP-binding protein
LQPLDDTLMALQGASLVYGAGEHAVHALRPTDVAIARGEYVAIMGKSGSGKSSLLNVMGLLTRPSSGTVLVDGQDAAALSDAQRSALRGTRLGFVFQDFHLLPMLSASANVQLPLVYARTRPAERRRRAAEGLAAVGLTERAHALPRELSGGERQRVAIARAVIHRPALLLCDEPTGNLDSGATGEVMSMFDEFTADGIAIALVTHDPDVAARAKRRLVVTDGTVAET